MILKSYFDNGGELHEKIGNKITERLLTSIQNPMPDDRKRYSKELPFQLYRVMVKEMTSAILKEKNTSISALNSKKILIFCGRFHIYFILYISLLPYYMFVI